MRASLKTSSAYKRHGHLDVAALPSSDNATPLLGHKAQALIACNQKLQELGIENTIKLPQICVVGDQSTGKSSLIEAISTIKVPKAKGCCTQCPIAINLSSGAHESSPWTCTVSIEERYHYNEDLLNKGVNKKNRFGPWQQMSSMKIVTVKTTQDKDEIPELIRAAQAAVLSPGARPSDFLGVDARQQPLIPTTKFSPNVIRLDVSEGNWPNLSFIDLPGVIANTSKVEEKYLVPLIRNLVTQYAEFESSVNMLTLPMTHDIENSQACALIQQVKAEPRTLAVFTKADLADDDQRAQFLRKSMGDDENLGFEHGYHYVVMPDNMDETKAREFEAAVFDQAPWSQLDREHQSRLGIMALKDYLRNLLFEKTTEALPGNLKSIEGRLNEVNAELISLPQPPNAALLPLQLQQSVTQFENSVKSLLAGEATGQGCSARREWNENALRFKKRVNDTKPRVYLLSLAEQADLNKAKAKIVRQHNKAENITEPIELSSEEENNHIVPVKTETTNGTRSKDDPAHVFRFEEIENINAKFYQACTPGEIEPRALHELSKLSVQHWDELLDEFMNATSKLLNKQINRLVKDVFGQYSHLELSSVIQQYVKEYLDLVIQEEWTLAEAVCQVERQSPMTLDHSNLKENEAKSLEERKAKRLEKRIVLEKTKAEAKEGISKKGKKEEIKLNEDEHHIHLVMASKARAYYEVASARFVDSICLGIFGRLLPACTGRLADSLKAYLGLTDLSKHDQIISWMAEDPEREGRRRRLLHEKKRLFEGLKYIQDVLGVKKSGPETYGKRRSSESPEIPLPSTPAKRAKTAHVEDDNHNVHSTPSKLTSRMKSIDLDN